MSRLPLLLIALLVLVPGGSVKPVAAAENPPAAPQPRPAKLKALPVAPLPHLPGEIDLTNVDPGFDPFGPFNVERIESSKVPPGTVNPNDPLGLPEVPGLTNPLPLPETGLGPLTGVGGMMGGTAFLGRTSAATKARLLKEYGGNEASELAVASGLAWLAKQQKPDGSWEFDGSARQEKVAATGMCLLAFLGAGETHKGNGKDKKTVQMGLTYLLRNVGGNGANGGKFNNAATMYSQAIGTLALVEAYGMTLDSTLKGPAQAAVNYVQQAQAADGSWGYAAKANGDTSILGWQIQVLVAARQVKDLKVDEKVFKKAVEFLDKVAGGTNKATYGYRESMGGSPGTSLTAVGLWCRAGIDGWTPKNAGLMEGVEGLLKRTPTPAGRVPDTYFLHYAIPVVRDSGGDAWKNWNEGPKQDDGTRKGGMRDVLVGLQSNKEGDKLGSWDADESWIGRCCGRVGTTALCVVALEAYYRHLPPEQLKVKSEK